MITRIDFASIDKEVKGSVIECLDYIRNCCSDHNYLLFLADAEYQPQYYGTGFSPYVIENKIDHYKDETRQRFFTQFMETFYSFANNLQQTTDNEYRLTMELMVYCHLWESKPFLKQLFRLSSLVSGKPYEWKVEVPEMSKHDYIRKAIRDTFKKSGLSIADIISKGFHTSLRNAFAHSEYGIDEKYSIISLDTYKGAAWDIKDITFDDWTIRFVYSAFLYYHFLNEKQRKRESINKDLGKNHYKVVHPINDHKFRIVNISYVEDGDRFVFST